MAVLVPDVAQETLATKADLAELKADIIKWNMSLVIAMTGIFAAIVKIFCNCSASRPLEPTLVWIQGVESAQIPLYVPRFRLVFGPIGRKSEQLPALFNPTE